MSIPYFIIAIIFFFIGFLGLIIPIVPDLIVIWLGVLIYALGTRFSQIPLTTVILLGVLSGSTFIIDYLATVLGAKRYGASKNGIVGGIIGGIMGLIVLPPLGFVIGMLAGISFVEVVLLRRGTASAIKVGKGALIGFTLGFLTKVIIAGVIIGVFLYSIFR